MTKILAQNRKTVVDSADVAALENLTRRLSASPIVYEQGDEYKIYSDGQLARHVLKQRRRRNKILADDLMADAAWDIVLDLFAAQEEKVAVSVTSACIASSVPPTTGLRTVSLLEQRGVVIRRRHEQDRRASLLTLNPDVARDVRIWLRETFSLRLTHYSEGPIDDALPART